jgi:hypothetical protein
VVGESSGSSLVGLSAGSSSSALGLNSPIMPDVLEGRRSGSREEQPKRKMEIMMISVFIFSPWCFVG